MKKIIAPAFAAIILAVIASGTASAASVGPYWSNYASWSSTPSGTYTANYGDSVMLTVCMVEENLDGYREHHLIPVITTIILYIV